MAKITRKAAKIFGASAGANEIAEFGSLAAGSPVFTTDPDVIQTLSNYLEGWVAAVIGSNSPAIEDMNALCYLFAYQIAYTMQAGVPEYNSGTTYYIGSLVNSGGILFVSRTDTNLGNPVTDSTKWTSPTFKGLVTPTTLDQDLVVPAASTMTWPNLTIASSKTLTVPSTAYLLAINPIIASGTLVVSGSGIVRVLA